MKKILINLLIFSMIFFSLLLTDDVFMVVEVMVLSGYFIYIDAVCFGSHLSRVFNFIEKGWQERYLKVRSEL